jgi:hypothetical protein
MSGQENFEELESVEDEIEFHGDHQDEKTTSIN